MRWGKHEGDDTVSINLQFHDDMLGVIARDEILSDKILCLERDAKGKSDDWNTVELLKMISKKYNIKNVESFVFPPQDE